MDTDNNNNRPPSLTEDPFAYKVVFVGPAAAGKTSLNRRMVGLDFFDEELPTIGAIFNSQLGEFLGETFTELLWDTAGLERFSALTPHYLRQAAVVVAVVSLESLDEPTPERDPHPNATQWEHEHPDAKWSETRWRQVAEMHDRWIEQHENAQNENAQDNASTQQPTPPDTQQPRFLRELAKALQGASNAQLAENPALVVALNKADIVGFGRAAECLDPACEVPGSFRAASASAPQPSGRALP